MMYKITLFIHGLGSNQKVWDTLLEYISEKSIHSYGNAFVEYSDDNVRSLDTDNIYYTYLNYDSSIIGTDNLVNDLLGKRNSLKDKEIQDLVGVLATKIAHLKAKGFKHINIVSHSLGGVVVIRYLLDKINNEQQCYMENIVYIASPFLGSKNSNILYDIFEKYVLKYLPFRPTKILKQLKTNAPFIEKLKSDIKTHASELTKIQTVYFYGINDGRIENPQKLVEKFSEYKVLNCEHSNILRKNDANSMMLYESICNMVNHREIEYFEEVFNDVKYMVSKNVINKRIYGEIMGECTKDRGVAIVNWNEAVAFCEGLSKIENRSYKLLSADEYKKFFNGNDSTPNDVEQWCSNIFLNDDVLSIKIYENNATYRRNKEPREDTCIGFRICRKIEYNE